jgi:hypothetical protein
LDKLYYLAATKDVDEELIITWEADLMSSWSTGGWPADLGHVATRITILLATLDETN